MTRSIRIVKRYRDWTPRAGIIEVDTVAIAGGAAECAAFVTKINANHRHEFEIIDYGVAWTSDSTREIIENPTGGHVGSLGTKH